MKKRKVITIFAAMIVSSHLFCMEKKTPKEFGMTIFPKQSNNSLYQNLEDSLKDSVRTTDGIEYSALERDFQYDLLKTCIQNDQMDRLHLCLKYKFNPNRYHKKTSLFHCAIKHRRPKAITLLSQYNPDLIPCNKHKQTPLDYAVNLKHKACITAMGNAISNKINELLRHQKHCGLTKHILRKGFCKECVVDLIWELRRHNLKEDYPYKTLETFLKNIIFTKDDINCEPIPPYLQCKMLRAYIKKDDVDFLSLCLNYAFNANHLHKKSSLLHCSIKHHSSASITILAEHNTDLIVKNDKEQTPLDYAVLLGCEDCIHAMHAAIVTKINQIVIYKKPYESEDYVNTLIHQLGMHGLYATENNTAPLQPLFVTDNAATVADSSSASYSSS